MFCMLILTQSRELRGLDEDTFTIEDMGDIVNNTAVFDNIIKYFFKYNMPSIVSYKHEDAECYYIGDRCIFELENDNIFMEIDFDEDKPLYTMIVSHNNMRRQLQGESCNMFNDDLIILEKGIECKITEYAHIIKIKNI